MQYKAIIGLAILMAALLRNAHANIPLMSPIGAALFGPAVLAVLLAIACEVFVVLFLLRKKSLRVGRVAIVLFIANIISFTLFLILLPTVITKSPDSLIVVSEILVIIFETLLLAGATRLSILRYQEARYLRIKDLVLPVFAGNIVSIVVGLLLISFILSPSKPDPVAISISGQGIWESTLQARDLDGNPTTIEGYYDTELKITWLADTDYSKDTTINWDDANALLERSIIYGITDWRLPRVKPVNGISFGIYHSNNGTTDGSHAATTTDGTDGGWRDSEGRPVSEMGHMYYVNLGNLGYCRPDDKHPDTCIEQHGWGLSNTGPFSIMPGIYWSGTEDHETGSVYTFIFDRGDQYSMGKSHGFTNRFVWPVHDGDIGVSVSNE